MAGYVNGANHGQLSIAAAATISLMDARWRCFTLSRVASKAVRGSDLVLPTVDGELSRRRRRAAIYADMEMKVTGAATNSGGTASGAGAWYTTLAANTAALSVIADPPASNTGYTATWTAPGITAKTAAVLVEDFEVDPDTETGGRLNVVTFTLVIPAGVWA